MNKQLETIISRVFTAVLFWAVFTIYAMFKGLEVDHLETLVLAELSGLFMPFFIQKVAKRLK